MLPQHGALLPSMTNVFAGSDTPNVTYASPLALIERWVDGWDKGCGTGQVADREPPKKEKRAQSTSWALTETLGPFLLDWIYFQNYGISSPRRGYVITTINFAEIWDQHYARPLCKAMQEYGTARDAELISRIRTHLVSSGIFCEQQIDDEQPRRDEERPLDVRALENLLETIRQDNDHFLLACARVAQCADTESSRRVNRLSLGVIAMIDMAVAKISSTIATCNDLPLPGLS